VVDFSHSFFLLFFEREGAEAAEKLILCAEQFHLSCSMDFSFFASLIKLLYMLRLFQAFAASE